MHEDLWSAWLNRGRHAGDAAAMARVAAETARYAGKILDAVSLRPGMAMLDLGSGAGLMGWAALERCPNLTVTLSDISAPLLDEAERTAHTLGFAASCRFIVADAANLGCMADASQDLVTARSCLAYVADKPAAFAEIFRVLRPGGWLSVAEPLFRDEALGALAMRTALARAPDAHLAVLHKWKAAQFPDDETAIAASPITNYTERELLGFAQRAGFTRARLELEILAAPSPPNSWSVFCATAPHPWAPSLDEIMVTSFTPDERARLEEMLRPAVEAGTLNTARRMVYLAAQKPN